jgi:hypothetical protein
MAEALTKVAAKTAAEVCRRFALSEEARPLLKDAMAPQQFLALLQEKLLYTDALRFLAQALPNRESVFWAYTCAKQATGAGAAEPAAKALAATLKWVTDPTEANRRAVQPLYEAAGIGTPAGCAAVAAFWSGGSMAPEGLPEVPAPENLCGHGSACAAMLAAAQGDPAKYAERCADLLAKGTAIAAGKVKWT